MDIKQTKITDRQIRNRIAVRKYSKSEKGKRVRRESARRYYHTEKGRAAFLRGYRNYYSNHREEITKRRKIEYCTPLGRFKRAVRSAKYEKHEWDIPFTDFVNFLKKPCFYCGGSLNSSGKGLDRMDNSKGYILSNVVQCCKPCNTIKGPYLTHEEMAAAMLLITTMRKNEIPRYP